MLIVIAIFLRQNALDSPWGDFPLPLKLKSSWIIVWPSSPRSSYEPLYFPLDPY